MKLYNHLQPKDAKFIITCANKGISMYKIAKQTGINKDKIRRCLNSCKTKKIKANLSKPWQGQHIKITYNFKQWLVKRDLRKVKRAYRYAQEVKVTYQHFVDFCKKTYETELVMKKKVKRSVDKFLKEFKKIASNQYEVPSRSWVYVMAKDNHYASNPKWLPSKKQKDFSLKSDHEQRKATKFNLIDDRPDKKLLRSTPGNYEIDSLIGKKTDKQALLTLIDIHNGNFYSRFYNRTMQGFKEAIKIIIVSNKIEVKTLTMNNGGENNLLHKIIERSKLFNCHAYCSGEKCTLENKHRIVRRVLHKSESLNKYSNQDLNQLNNFVNNYYSKTFNRI